MHAVPTQTDLFRAADEPLQRGDASPQFIDMSSQGTSIEVIPADEPERGSDAAPPTIDSPTQGTSIQVTPADKPQPNIKRSAKSKPKQAGVNPRALGSTQEYLSDIEVADLFGVSRPTVWRWTLKNPRFPSPKHISPGTSKWKLSEIRAFQTVVDAGLRFEADKDGRKVKKCGSRPKSGGSAK